MSNLFGGDDVDVSGEEASVAEDEKKAKSIRSALYATDGGSSGVTLDPTEVKKRQTIYGN